MDLSRFSCCSIALARMTVEEAFPIIAAAGFKKVDLLNRAPQLSLDPAESDPEAILRVAEDNGLQIANLGTYVGTGFESDDRSVQEKALKDLKRAVDLAVFFGSRSIRAKAGNDDAQFIDRIVPWFQRGAEYAEKHNIPMGIENHGGTISGNPEMCVKLFEKVGSPYFGVLYEPANLMHATDYRYSLGVMHNHVNHVHFKPSKGIGPTHELTTMAESELDLHWVMTSLDRIGYKGDIAIEYEYRGEPAETGLAKWVETIKAM
jgi:sugar phosphate isomerase/epimerase